MIENSAIKPEHLWYFVGLLTTDGNLSPDGRHIVLVSKDVEHLEKIRGIFNLPKLGRKASGTTSEKIYGVLQFGDVKFYRFLLSLGLSPKKSMILKEIAVPPAYFKDFLRGVIDGDGCIRKWIHPTNGHLQWEVKIVSAAEHFSKWLYNNIEQDFKVRGTLMTYPIAIKRKNTLYVLKYGKMAAQKILSCYTHSTLALARKCVLAEECIQAENGWSKSVTVLQS